MDPVSQGALGAAATLAIWGNDKRLSRHVIGWLGALSAMAPDLDIFIRSSTDSLLAIEYHRHFTHSLSFVPFGATLALLPWLVLSNVRRHFKVAWLISFAGYLTHAPLDCATTYGTQFFWPFSSYRVSLSWVSVVDPLFTLPLLGLIIGGGFKTSNTLFRVGLAWALAYVLLGAAQKHRVLKMQDRIVEARGQTATRRDVFTTFMNQVTWRSLYEANGQIYIDQIRVPYLGTPCTKEGSVLTAPPPPPANLGPSAERGHRLIRWFSSGWVAFSPSDPTLLGDLRYSFHPYGADPFWGVRIDTSADRVEWVQTAAERKISFRAVWDLIFENPAGSVCY